MMKFAYLKDRLFLVCFSLYWVHKALVLSGFSVQFLRSYLNDLILIPFWIPILLWVQHRIGLRPQNGPPTAIEIVIPLLIWGLVFEVILPQTPGWQGLAIADPYDILSYSLGGLGAFTFWNWWYADPQLQNRPIEN